MLVGVDGRSRGREDLYNNIQVYTIRVHTHTRKYYYYTWLEPAAVADVPGRFLITIRAAKFLFATSQVLRIQSWWHKSNRTHTHECISQCAVRANMRNRVKKKRRRGKNAGRLTCR